MGLLDQFFAQPGLLNDMPPWMQALVQKPGDSQVPPWMQTPLGAPAVPGQFPPMQQDPAALPPNAQQAGPGQLPPQLQQALQPQQEPRRSIWTPADAPDDSPPVNPNAPQNLQRMAGPALGAPQMPQQQAPGMQAMAQANLPQGQPPQAAPQQGGGIMDFLWGGADKRAGTTAALAKMGIDPQVAAAMARDKGLMAIAAPSLIGGKSELKETGSDPITGQKTFQVWNPGTQTMRPVNGGVGGGSQPTPSSMLAPGVAAINHNLSGDAYLAQFSPEVQAAVKAYISGDVMPSGNPRTQGLAAQAKIIAQKYGADTGVPVSDAIYSQRRGYRTQLGSNSPNSAGGQAKAFNQGIEHMGALADTLEKLDNSNGMGIPMVAGVVNSIRQGTSTEQSAIADKASSIGQTLAGEVGKLFSGTAGGGVHERQMTRERFDTVKSKPQLAAALEATLEVMRGGLTALEQRRDEVLGPDSNVKFVTKETEEKIAKIESVIERLKKGESPASAAPQSAPAAEKTATAADGRKIVLRNGQWVPLK